MQTCCVERCWYRRQMAARRNGPRRVAQGSCGSSPWRPQYCARTAFADARAKLRKEFRQRLSVGAWNDMFTHIFKRERFINPTPAAEAKLLGEKMARNAAFREVRAQAIKRRLDEGEALGSRAQRS